MEFFDFKGFLKKNYRKKTEIDYTKKLLQIQQN